MADKKNKLLIKLRGVYFIMHMFYIKSLINPERVKIKMENMVYTYSKIAGAALFHFSHDTTSSS